MGRHDRAENVISPAKRLWNTFNTWRGEMLVDDLLEVAAGLITWKYLSEVKAASDVRLPKQQTWQRLRRMPRARLAAELTQGVHDLCASNPRMNGVFDQLVSLPSEIATELFDILDGPEPDEAATAFDGLLELFRRAGGRSGGESSTAPQLVALLTAAAGPMLGTVYDPAAGTGGLLLAAAQRAPGKVERRGSGTQRGGVAHHGATPHGPRCQSCREPRRLPARRRLRNPSSRDRASRPALWHVMAGPGSGSGPTVAVRHTTGTQLGMGMGPARHLAPCPTRSGVRPPPQWVHVPRRPRRPRTRRAHPPRQRRNHSRPSIRAGPPHLHPPDSVGPRPPRRNQRPRPRPADRQRGRWGGFQPRHPGSGDPRLACQEDSPCALPLRCCSRTRPAGSRRHPGAGTLDHPTPP